jgi:hypothetical protein
MSQFKGNREDVEFEYIKPVEREVPTATDGHDG